MTTTTTRRTAAVVAWATPAAPGRGQGSLIVSRDKMTSDNQKQDVAGLSRDAEHTSGSLSPVSDKEKA